MTPLQGNKAMFIPKTSRGFSLNHPWVEGCFTILVGLGLGALSFFISPLVELLLIAAGFAMVLVLKRPEFAVIGTLIALSSIVSVDSLPLVPIGIGSLNIIDLLLLGMLGVIFLRWLIEPQFVFMNTPFNILWIIFCGLSILSTILAIANGTVVSAEGLRETRTFSYYFVFFVVVNLVRLHAQFRRLWWGLIILAGVVVIAMVLQYTFPETHFLPGYVELLSKDEQSDVIRLRQPGETLILVMSIVGLTMFITGHARYRIANFFYLLLMIVGVMLTFNRQYWISLFASFGILFVLVNRKERGNYVRLGGGIVAVILLCLGIFLILPQSPVAKLVEAVVSRLFSITEEDYQSAQAMTSLGFRAIENSYAVNFLTPPPLIGMGWGMKYRPRSEIDWDEFDGRGYIHNAHFGLMLRSGFLAYAAFVAISALSVIRSLYYWRRIPDLRLRAMVLGFTMGYLNVFVGAFVHPALTDLASIPVLATMIGFNEAVIQRYVLSPDTVDIPDTQSSLSQQSLT